MIAVAVADLPVAAVHCDGRGRMLECSEPAALLMLRWPDLAEAIAALVVRNAIGSGAREMSRFVRTSGAVRLMPIQSALAEASPASWVVFIVADSPGRDEDQDPLAALSPREREVAALAVDGMRNREIAERLGCSERTVRAHLQSSYQKLGCRSRVELASRILSVV